MSFGVRGGSFGNPGGGGYRTGGGGISGNYSIGQSATDTASLDKYVASVQWQNGVISDDQYEAALRRYVASTDPGSRQRVSATQELKSAVYSIDRNKITRKVNNAPGSSQKVSALYDLIAFDKKHLSGMDRASQEYRDTQDRITQSQQSIRAERYNALMDVYNAGGNVTTQQLLAYAQRASRESQGAPDQQQWSQTVTSLTGRITDENYSTLLQDYQMKRVDGGAVLKFIDQHLSTLNPNSAQHDDWMQRREDFAKSFQSQQRADTAALKDAQFQNGTITDEEYIAYLQSDMSQQKKGTKEYRDARDKYLDTSFGVAERRIQNGIANEGENPMDLVNLYQSKLATMVPGSSQYLYWSQKIADAQVAATQGTDLFGTNVPQAFDRATGHWVLPGGTPTNNAGFESQFDGSAYASTNCLQASGAMLAWDVTGGKKRVSGGDLRYYSGDTSGGTNPPDLVRALAGIGIKAKDQKVSPDQFWRLLTGGTPMAITGLYGNLNSNYRLSATFTGLHGMFAQTGRVIDGHKWVYIMDPIGRGGYKGQWMPIEEVEHFMYGAGGTGGWVVTAGRGSDQRTKAGKPPKGQAPSFEPPANVVPFQAFDTDWQGNSTLGRGGGTNPQEGGPTQDWSNGKPHVATGPRIGSDPGTVSAFLGAINTVEANGNVTDPWQGEARTQHAQELLAKYNGDARLAGMEWFTGSTEIDSSKWGQQQNFYANAVGGALGYGNVPRQGIGILTPANAAPTAGLTPGGGTTVTPEGTTAPVSTQPKIADTPANRLAQVFLAQIGAPVTPDMVRAVNAWIGLEGDKLHDNNAFNLKTNGPHVLFGQTGVTEDGVAVFDSPESGAIAAARELMTEYPDVAGAFRGGNPSKAINALGTSDWNQSQTGDTAGYGPALVAQYNTLPGAKLIGGGQSYLQSFPDIASLAHATPDVGTLFSIIPQDPIQKAWFDRNLAAMENARQNGADKFTFETISGQRVTLDFKDSYYRDMLETNSKYAENVLDTLPPTATMSDYNAAQNDVKSATSRWLAYGDIVHDEWSDGMATMDKLAQQALASGDLTAYANIRFLQKWTTENVMGVPHDGQGQSQNPNSLSKNDLDSMQAKLESYSPAVGDPSSEAYNADGDKTLGFLLAHPGILRTTTGPDGLQKALGVAPDKWTYFMSQDADGNPELITVDDHPDLFQTVPGPVITSGPQMGTQEPIPAYQQQKPGSGYVYWTDPDGNSSWVKTSMASVQLFAQDTAGYRQAATPPMGMAPISAPPTDVAGTTWMLVSNVDIPSVTWKDQRTGTYHVYYSYDGFKTTLDYVRNESNPGLPALMLNTNASVPQSGPKMGQLVIGQDQHVYDPQTDAANLAGTVHWYGENPTMDKNRPGELGGFGQQLTIKTGVPSPGGGVGIDGTVTLNDMWRSGQLTPAQYQWGRRQEFIAASGNTPAAFTGDNGMAWKPPAAVEPDISATIPYANMRTTGNVQNGFPGPVREVGNQIVNLWTSTITGPASALSRQPGFPTLSTQAQQAVTAAASGRNIAALRTLAAQSVQVRLNQLEAARIAQANAAYHAQHTYPVVQQPKPIAQGNTNVGPRPFSPGVTPTVQSTPTAPKAKETIPPTPIIGLQGGSGGVRVS